MTKLAGPVFERIADTLVDALVAHADRALPAASATSASAASTTESPNARGANDG